MAITAKMAMMIKGMVKRFLDVLGGVAATAGGGVSSTTGS